MHGRKQDKDAILVSKDKKGKNVEIIKIKEFTKDGAVESEAESNMEAIMKAFIECEDKD